MATQKQIIERVIERTKADEIRWRKTGKMNSRVNYRTQLGAGPGKQMKIQFEGELIFTDPSGSLRFVIDIEVVEEDGLALLLHKAIEESMNRRVPGWVTEGVWPVYEAG